MAISTLDEFLETIPNDRNHARMVELLVWVGLTYPELELRIAYNQPILADHDMYSAVIKHMAMAHEHATKIRFEVALCVRDTGDYHLSYSRSRPHGFAKRIGLRLHPKAVHASWTRSDHGDR